MLHIINLANYEYAYIITLEVNITTYNNDVQVFNFSSVFYVRASFMQIIRLVSIHKTY